MMINFKDVFTKKNALIFGGGVGIGIAAGIISDVVKAHFSNVDEDEDFVIVDEDAETEDPEAENIEE